VPHVLMYTTRVCSYCVRAEKLLSKKGISPDQIEKIRVDESPERREEMMRRSGGRRTVPQIFIGDRHVGGFDDLAELDADGELDSLLQS